ncbi:gag-like protein [Lasius niger]|uniref:Gag-like protein n=1 Tax=Lasius niger TaxID=67767 RepID=A0A0J7JZG1_LASNI|nr:gag-like protein [Lasius niger]
MVKKKEKDVPAQGDGPPRARQSGNIVPVPTGSLSDDGLAARSEGSSTVAKVIASTSDVPWKRIVGLSVGSLSAETALQPVVCLSRVNVSPALGLPGTSGGSTGQPVSLRGLFGSPLDAEGTMTSAVTGSVTSAYIISDEDQGSGPSAKRKFDKVARGRVSKPPRRRRGRPPTSGEWVGITKAMEKYNAARAVELELDEIEYILDPGMPPKKTKGKRDLPSIEELGRDLADYSYEAIRKKSGESFKLLDKLSDKSSGLNGRLIHEMRMASRSLVAAVVELSDRAERQEVEVLKRKRSNDYLIKDIDKLRGELDIARAEILSLRASVSPSGRGPPHKKTRGLDDLGTREIGTQMDIGGWTRVVTA